jgi:hypothetical protein
MPMRPGSMLMRREPTKKTPTSSRRRRLPVPALAISGLCVLIAAVGAVYLVSEVQDATAAKARILGAKAIKRGKVPLQRRARVLAPRPKAAYTDRGKAHADGCLAYGSQVNSKPCVYGKPDSDTTVVLFGDSRAVQYFPAIWRISLKRGWRLVVLTRGLCFVADVKHNPNCDTWRENTLKRIENVEKPDLVVVGTATVYWWPLGGKKALPRITRGMTRTLRRLKATGAKVVVMRDQSPGPFKPPNKPGRCVAKHRRKLLKCAFVPGYRGYYATELWGARRAKVRTIDVQRHVCRRPTRRIRRWLCPAVIGNVIVYRDLNHYSATFVRTLTSWIAPRLPRIGG